MISSISFFFHGSYFRGSRSVHENCKNCENLHPAKIPTIYGTWLLRKGYGTVKTIYQHNYFKSLENWLLVPFAVFSLNKWYCIHWLQRSARSTHNSRKTQLYTYLVNKSTCIVIYEQCKLWCTVNSWKYAPFKQMPFPFLTPNFLHWCFSLFKRPCIEHFLGMLLVSFWLSFVIEFICIHVHTKSLYPHLLVTAKKFIARSTSLHS